MNDSMLTVRMPSSKKAAGVEVLAKLGLSITEAVNGLWDYLIAKGEMPSLTSENCEDDRAAMIQQAYARVTAQPKLGTVAHEMATLYETDRKSFRERKAKEDGLATESRASGDRHA